jgi:hypothetical protein
MRDRFADRRYRLDRAECASCGSPLLRVQPSRDVATDSPGNGRSCAHKLDIGLTACAGRSLREHWYRLVGFISSSDDPVLVGAARSVLNVKSELIE